jgi:putative restriction endonuclease
MEPPSQTRGVAWTDEHLLIALNLYSKIPFGRFHERNAALIEVAERLGRTPGSLAMKLCNIASLDPVFLASGRKGLAGASNKDRELWAAFQRDPDELGPKSEQLLHDLLSADSAEEVEVSEGGERLIRKRAPLPFATPEGPTEGMQWVKTRRGQSFFRGAVLSAYDRVCCITGLPDERLLEAAHIMSWSAAPKHRHDPRNGICLSKLHHAAFDAGLIGIDAELRVVVSPQLRGRLPNEVIEQSFLQYEGRPIARAVQNAEPDPAFFAWHREERFLR